MVLRRLFPRNLTNNINLQSNTMNYIFPDCDGWNWFLIMEYILVLNHKLGIFLFHWSNCTSFFPGEANWTMQAHSLQKYSDRACDHSVLFFPPVFSLLTIACFWFLYFFQRLCILKNKRSVSFFSGFSLFIIHFFGCYSVYLFFCIPSLNSHFSYYYLTTFWTSLTTWLQISFSS